MKNNISTLQNYAKEKGGLLLSDVYVNSLTRMLWQCAKGHRWYATFGSMKHRNSWCPDCSHKTAGQRRRRDISELKAYAESKGGKLLSDKYINQKTKMLWQCAKGHQWEAASGGMLQRGYWCPKCAGKQKRTISEAQELAKSREGICLSVEIPSVKTNLTWQCDKNHTFHMAFASIEKQNQWCPECSKNKRRDIDYAQKLAERFGGDCLSTKYKNNKTNLEWRCKHGHTWSARLNSVVSGFWCPVCSAGLGERICKIFFETIFQDDFVKVRPDWLLSPSGFRLELDGYSEKLKLAFEHQGQQHYRDIDRFSSKYSVQTRRDLDALKIKLCRKRGITLIEIPEIPNLTHIEDVKGVIKSACKSVGYPLPANFDSVEVDYLPAYQDNRFSEFQSLAERRGGKCHVELGYVEKNKVEWECGKGHVWLALPKVIRRGHWCPYCAQNVTLKLSDFKIIAKNRGGLCVSDKYVNMNSKLSFICHDGHEFSKSAGHVKHSGSWCNICSFRYLDLQKYIQKKQNIHDVTTLNANDKAFIKSYEKFVLNKRSKTSD